MSLSKEELELRILLKEDLIKKNELSQIKKAVREHKSNKRIELIKLFLTVMGAFGFIIGFFIENYNGRQAKTYARKIEIVNEYQTLKAKTKVVLGGISSMPVLLRVNIETYQDKLKELEGYIEKNNTVVNKKEWLLFIRDSQHLTNGFLSQLPVQYEVNNWTQAIELQTIWTSKKNSFTPDFTDLFGDEASGHWNSLREAALNVINEKYSIMSGPSDSLIEKFDNQSEAFEKILYQQVNR